MPIEEGANRVLTDSERKALLLGGTVSIPAHFPKLAVVTIVPDVNVFWRSDGNTTRALLQSVQTNDPFQVVTRLAVLDDVKAVFVPASASEADVRLSKGTWLFGQEIWKLKDAPQTGSPADGKYGIVYLSEQTPVWTRCDLALTAAESA